MTTKVQHIAPPHLNGRHKLTYEEIFRHPAAHNLEWHDVRSLLDAMADVAVSPNGSLHVTRNGHLVVLHAPQHKDVTTIEDLMVIRHFLEQSNEKAVTPPTKPT